MDFLKAFPIAIIDEDYEGKHAAGLGMRQLAEAIEKERIRVVAGFVMKMHDGWSKCSTASRAGSCLVDGAEARPHSGRCWRKY